MSASWSLWAHSDSPERTRAVAAALASVSRAGDLVVLVGGLGAGKTVFAQGFARALGVEGPVTSPTFTLLRQYRCSGPGGVEQLLHGDLYRLEHLAEVADLGLAELLEDGGVGLVEWGDKGAAVFGDDLLEVAFTFSQERDGVAGRELSLRSRGSGWADRRGPLAAALTRTSVIDPAVAP